MQIARPYRLTLAVTGGIVAMMVALVSVSVPLYRLFCAVTGAGGTTQRVAAGASALGAKVVRVYFNTDVSPGLPWRFEPVQRSVSVQLGQQSFAWFTATNLADRTIVGHATFNVTPDKTGLYFKKIQCFCFSEERLGPHETVQMPVQFFVDPALAKDAGTADVSEITLSYTFFESKRPAAAQNLARLAVADAGRGAAVFASNCGACHALDRAKVGPALGGLMGRQAGSEAGFAYSPALRAAGFAWTPARLQAWLADPQTVVAGTAMPMPPISAAEARDVGAYLARK